jgi:hypothetical protein
MALLFIEAESVWRGNELLSDVNSCSYRLYMPRWVSSFLLALGPEISSFGTTTSESEGVFCDCRD